MRTVPINTQAFFKRAVGVAEHYGFRNIDDLRATAAVHGTTALDLHAYQSPGEHIDQDVLESVLAHYAETVELKKKQPLMFYTPSLVHHPGVPGVRVSALTLNAVGAHDPLAEVVLLKCATSILEELGLKRYVLHINSIGDNDSSARYLRDVTVILRQRLRTLPDGFAERLRTNASAAIATLYEADHAVIAELPSPLDFLTAPSRKYFKEVLELLDHTGIPFVLNDKLYGDHNLYSHTIFELVEPPEEGAADQPAHGEVLGRGGRYDNLTRAYARNAVPATGVVLAVQTKDHDGPVGRPRRKKPSACLIHIGREARIRSIALVEQLRREKIPIDQCLHVERYSEQVAYAEANQNKYVVIMGQREAHNGVAIVRNALDRSQETISLELLPQYLRQMA